MALDDMEMNRLGRARSAIGGSSFTCHGLASISDAGITWPSPGRAGGPSRDGSGSMPGDSGMKARVGRFIDSFRRGEGTRSNFSFSVTDANADHDGRPGPTSGIAAVREHQGERYYDLRSANAKTASTLLARELKGRHLQMIAISGSIGTGFFVASGIALSQGGPASVLLAYLIVGGMLWCTVQALGEMAVVFPVAGSFSAFSTRFLDPSWGFAMGWK